jgi:hypothetical protein
MKTNAKKELIITVLSVMGDKRIRGSMVRDLSDRKLLIGKSVDEVVDILGKPDSQLKNDYRYFIDIGHTFCCRPWFYYFDVIFDSKTQKVTATTYGD